LCISDSFVHVLIRRMCGSFLLEKFVFSMRAVCELCLTSAKS
jgi:hypothetical protein